MGIWSRKAFEGIGRIRRHFRKCLLVHYSCQSLYDDRDGLSPRVANIVVRDLDSEQTFSFAIHLVAERLHIPKADIDRRYDEIESVLLEDFYNFVRSHPGFIWLHWNMINLQFGFETLAHRYGVLTGKNAPSIDMDDRINIAGLLIGKFGENYVDAPHMQNLMKVNGGPKRDFVPGKEEVELFKNGEFALLHASTISKVEFFSEVVHLLLDGKLKTERASLMIRAERTADNGWAKLVGLAAAVYTLVDLAGKAGAWRGIAEVAHRIIH